MAITKRHHTAALAFANRVREVMGKKPVKRLAKGEVGSGGRCAIARTITRDEDLIFVSDVHNENGRYTAVASVCGIEDVKGGLLVGDFIRAFDKGEIPELVR